MRALITISIILSLAFACQYSGFTDLTPNNGFNTEIAFNVPALNQAISDEDIEQDTGWMVIEAIEDIYSPSPFVKNVQMIGTDTFAFEWQDYKPVMKQIHRIANHFEMTNSVPDKSYKWLNKSQMYSNPDSYLIPLFNSEGYRYWLQVFREKVNWHSYYYTARGIWLIADPVPVDGDVS